MNSVRTSQETRYVSATETNRLLLFLETVRMMRNTQIRDVGKIDNSLMSKQVVCVIIILL
jgi:hypothetical protein